MFALDLEAVHFRQQLIDDPRRGIRRRGRTFGTQGIDFIEEDDGRRGIARALEDGSYRTLRFTHVHVQQLRPLMIKDIKDMVEF